MPELKAVVRRARPRRQPAAGGAVRFRPRRRDASRASTASRRRTVSAHFRRAELSAISAIVAYVEKTQKAERPPLNFPEREENGSTLFIDPATRANLELMKTLSGSRDGSLFRAIDRTVTGAGARHAGRPADLAADRSRWRSTGGSIRSASSSPRRGLCEALRAVAERRRRHAARADQAGAQPRRSARPRRAALGFFARRARSRRCLPARRCRKSLAAALKAIAALPREFAGHLEAGAGRRAAAAEARRRLLARRLRPRARRVARAGDRVAARDPRPWSAT